MPSVWNGQERECFQRNSDDRQRPIGQSEPSCGKGLVPALGFGFEFAPVDLSILNAALIRFPPNLANYKGFLLTDQAKTDGGSLDDAKSLAILVLL